MAANVGLPEGFVLDNQQANSSLPDGFVLDAEAQAGSPKAQAQHPDQSLMQQAGDWLTGGASAGQIVEQAARGLANIPFDLAQGISNAATSVGNLLGADGTPYQIPRPVDRPSDQYAQAGETIGGYLLPLGRAAKALGATADVARGISTAGNMAAGSVSEAANQQGDFAQNVAQNAAVNLGTQGVLSGAAKLVGRGITALKGDIAPDIQRVISNAENAGVTPMTSDVLPPNNALTRGLIQGGEGAILGTGAQRGEQYATRSKLLGNFFDRFGAYNPEDIVRSLTSTLKGRKNAAGAVRDDIVNRMGKGPIETSSSINAIDTNIARLEKLGTSADQGLLTALKNLKGELKSGNVDFDLLQQHRTAFRTNVQGDAMVFPNQAKTATNMVENAMTRDLRNAVGKTLGPQDAAKYLKSNSDFANIYNKVLNKRISNTLNKASSEYTPELVNTVVYSRNASDIKRIWGALDDNGKDAMRSAYISKIAEKTGDSPAKFLTEINKLKAQAGGEIYNTIFSVKHMKELDALHEVLQQTARSDSANVVTQTGQALANPIRIGAGVSTLGSSLAGEAGYGLLLRAYESKPVRNALLRLSNTKPGTPAYEKALNQAAVVVRPMISNQVTQK